MWRSVKTRWWSMLLALLAFSTVAGAQGALQIVSPTSGTIVHPGDTITVTVSTSGGPFAAVIIIPAAPIPSGEMRTAPPFQFVVKIPSEITCGQYSLIASGVISPGNPIASPPIYIDVERPDAPVALSTEPACPLELYVGEQMVLDVLGTYADGSTQDITNSSQTSFVSQATNIVTVSSSGLVTAVSPGATRIVVNGSLTVPVTVDEPVIMAPITATMTAGETRQFVAWVTANASNGLRFARSRI